MTSLRNNITVPDFAYMITSPSMIKEPQHRSETSTRRRVGEDECVEL
jgi:hypothetical protein